MKEIYFDNSATTEICASAREAMETMITKLYANPSSLHKAGFDAEKQMSRAREIILSSLGAEGTDDKIVFTASGTEANNLALSGVAHSKSRFRGGKIIISDAEHPCIENTARALEKENYKVERIPTKNGVFDMERFIKALSPDTFLVSVMTVNNETGAVFNISEIFKEAKKRLPDVITHTDAVQAYMKIPLSPKKSHCDLVTISSHKIHGPKGAGALYISSDIIKKKSITPIIHGGGQEYGLRSGTENTVCAVGFGGAVAAAKDSFIQKAQNITEVRDYLESKLSDIAKINKPPARAPHIISCTLPNIKSETMLHYLSLKGIYVSAGSACSSRAAKENRVLEAFGLSKKDSECTIRISLCENNTKEEAEICAKEIAEGIKTLARLK